MSSASENLQYAREAIDYVHGKLQVGHGNKPFHMIGSFFETTLCVVAMRGTEIAQEESALTPLALLRAMAVKAEHVGCGNCGESAMIAFVHLYDRGVRPLDMMEGGKDVDHAFVVIGREQGSDASDPKTWGRTAVICDPWGDRWDDTGKAFYATEFREKMYKGAKMMPNVVHREV